MIAMPFLRTAKPLLNVIGNIRSSHMTRKFPLKRAFGDIAYILYYGRVYNRGSVIGRTNFMIDTRDRGGLCPSQVVLYEKLRNNSLQALIPEHLERSARDGHDVLY